MSTVIKCNYASACVLQADMHGQVHVYAGMPGKFDHWGEPERAPHFCEVQRARLYVIIGVSLSKPHMYEKYSKRVYVGMMVVVCIP